LECQIGATQFANCRPDGLMLCHDIARFDLYASLPPIKLQFTTRRNVVGLSWLLAFGGPTLAASIRDDFFRVAQPARLSVL